MKNKALLFSSFLLYVMVLTNALGSVGYYDNACPQAEDIVKGVVAKALYRNRRVGASLIRLQFHDCFVRGCDASVLLDPSWRNPHPEKQAPKNDSLRGFDVIDEAKIRLELSCPGVVSCADTIAFAAHNATEILNGIGYNVTAGRVDGKVFWAIDAQLTLPAHESDLEMLKDLFVTKKGHIVEDLVVLSGAHTVGMSHCDEFLDRLYRHIDPTLDNDFAIHNLTTQCPKFSNFQGVVDLDYVSPLELDSQYYRNLLDHKVLFYSDASLMTSDETLELVNEYATTPGDWEADFAESMPKLSMLDWITDPLEGEIRADCCAVNF